MITKKVMLPAGFIQIPLAWLIPVMDLIADSVVFTFRGQPKEYGRTLEGDCYDVIDFRHGCLVRVLTPQHQS